MCGSGPVIAQANGIGVRSWIAGSLVGSEVSLQAREGPPHSRYVRLGEIKTKHRPDL